MALRAVPAAERRCSVAVEYVAAEVVPLAAAAVVEDLLAAVRVAHRGRGARRPRGSRCPSRSPRTCRRAAGAAGAAPARRDRSGSGRAAAPSRTCSPARPGGPCRRGSARTCCPSAPRRISMPQLHSHRMHAVCCHGRSVRHVGHLDHVGHLRSLVEKDNRTVAKIYLECHRQCRRLAEHEADRAGGAGARRTPGRRPSSVVSAVTASSRARSIPMHTCGPAAKAR